jgi:phenylacetate-CoA ligase
MISASHFVRSTLAFCRHPGASPAELKEFQDAQLRRLVCHAYAAVPFYRKLFDRHRLHPRHIRGTVDLELIPTITKQELRAQIPRNVVAAGLDPAKLLTARTSGSSGEPFVIRRTWTEQSLQYLLQLRAFGLLGVRLGDRIATVALVRPRNPADAKVIGRALHATGLKQTLKIDGLQDPADVLAQLEAYRPDVITGMPGMLCRVAEHLLAQGKRKVNPRLLIVGGEVLTPVMRRRLTEAFNAPVRETYASHEFPLLGWECARGGEFQTSDDGVILEVLHEGRPAREGERGEVVATNLHAYAMPFIRYRLGDIATRGEHHPNCSQPFSSIRNIQGRMIDYFPLPDGRVIHPYQILVSFIGGGDGWIRQYQLLQEREDHIVLRVQPAQAPDTERVAALEQSVVSLLGPQVTFRVQLVDDLPLEESGKFRPSRSLVRSTSHEFGVSASRVQ